MSKTDWIIACDGSNPDLPFGFKCLHCGKHEPVGQPIPLDVYALWAERFTKQHENCKPDIHKV